MYTEAWNIVNVELPHFHLHELTTTSVAARQVKGYQPCALAPFTYRGGGSWRGPLEGCRGGARVTDGVCSMGVLPVVVWVVVVCCSGLLPLGCRSAAPQEPGDLTSPHITAIPAGGVWRVLPPE